MGFVPGFANDIFISYSHLDDQAVVGPGWVSDFHRRLVIEVGEALGAEVRVWRDKRITGATDFPKDLDRQIRGSAMLLAVVSPGYVNSTWCDWELTGFAGSRRVGDLWVDTKCRAIKVFKRPADVSRLRALADTGGVNLFDVDPETGLSHEMEGTAELFKHRLTELGHDIAGVLRAMRKARTVFLGTASQSMRDQRERVRQELTGREYRVVTAREDVAGDTDAGVHAAMRDSALSVLFYDRGKANGETAHAQATRERRIALDQQSRQVIVVRGHSDGARQPWDEPDAQDSGSARIEWLIAPAAHTLYHTVLQMLDVQAVSMPPDPDPPTLPPGIYAPEVTAGLPLAQADDAEPRRLVRVYLVCDQRDHPLLESNTARRLRDHLLALGFEVKVPLADHDDAAEFSRDNRNKLKQCDAVLLYWGTSRQAWFDQRLGELLQARGWRQGREFAALGAYLANPENPVKQNYETRELHELIKQFDTLDITDARLGRFVARLRGHP